MTKKKVEVGLVMLGLFLGMTSAGHAADLITNGGFETLTHGLGQIGNNTDATGWTTTGYNFVFGATGADSTGVTGSAGNLKLWGPHSSPTASNNGLTASPNGGNFIAADGAYQVGAITQDIVGLTIGHTYEVGFYWAAAQQQGFTGATTEQWKVSLGGDTQSTSVANNADHGFVPWQAKTFDYVATSTSETLSFLAVGTPNGKPPFVLLDGVTLNDLAAPDVPEPTALVAMFAGAIGLGVFASRRARAAKPVA
jgi:hypothetical protein